MPWRKRQFTYNLHRAWESRGNRGLSSDNDAEKCKRGELAWAQIKLCYMLHIVVFGFLLVHTSHILSWCLLSQRYSSRWVWVHVGWFLRKHCAPHRKCGPGHQWCHCPWADRETENKGCRVISLVCFLFFVFGGGGGFSSVHLYMISDVWVRNRTNCITKTKLFTINQAKTEAHKPTQFLKAAGEGVK